MEKMYKGNFGELEKLIDYGQITKDHPYYNLYKYIKEINIERLRTNKIRVSLTENINRVRCLIENNFNNNCGIINLEMQPYITGIYQEVLNKYKKELEKISELEDEEEYNTMVKSIHSELKSTLNENTIIRAKEAKRLYDTLIDECSETLNGIKFKGKYLINETIEDGKIKRRVNNETVRELTNKLSERELEAFIMLDRFENKKMNLTQKCLEISSEIENSKNTVFTYIVKRIQEKINKYEKRIFENVSKDKKLLKTLQIENIILKENGNFELNLTTDRLGELNFSGELFELLNIRCRLKDVEEKVLERITTEYYDENIKNYIEIPPFEKMEQRLIDEELDSIYEKYKKEKSKEYNEHSMAIANIEANKELYKTPIIKELEQELNTNILTITMPTAPGMISRRNALYIVKTLIELNENLEDLDKFLQNEKVSELPNIEQTLINNIAMEKIREHIEKEDEDIKNLNKQRRLK